MKKEKDKPEKKIKSGKDDFQEKIIKDLQMAIDDIEKKKNEYYTGWQRAEADFQNYKKQETERLESFSGYVKENIFENLLPILDNFDLAEKVIPADKKEESNIKGLLLIKKQMDYFLKSIGVEEIKAVGQKFDPMYHEALEETEQEGEPGTITEEIQKGYLLNNKVFRPSKVKIIKSN
jgi:molecular chaperone GrpE